MDFLRVILLSIFLACSSSEAFNFIIGGKNGWSLHPSENYRKWAHRMRFQVNDTLTFKYSKETDSVVVVTKNDYKKCNAANPIQKMDGGDSVFKFDRSGPFYFITGNKSNCDHGQKLIILVLAVRNKSPSVPAPSPAAPSVPAPSPVPDNDSPVPSPDNKVLGPAVSPAPIVSGPAVSPAPIFSGPAVSPAPVDSGPVVSPAPGTLGPAANTPSPLSPGNAPFDFIMTPAPAPSKSLAPANSPAMLVTAVLSVTVAAFITFA